MEIRRSGFYEIYDWYVWNWMPGRRYVPADVSRTVSRRHRRFKENQHMHGYPPGPQVADT